MPRSNTKSRNPLSFTYTTKGCPQTNVNLEQRKRIDSRESLGVWVIDNWAWKVFSEETQWDRVEREYASVKHYALVAPQTFWIKVTVKYDNKTQSQGFVIASPFINVKDTSFYSFDFKNGTGSLESVIKKKIKDIEALRRCIVKYTTTKKLTKLPQD